MTQDKVSTKPEAMDHADPVAEPHKRTVDLVVWGPPMPKARPRIVMPEGHSHPMGYTPKPTRSQSQEIRAAYVRRYEQMQFKKHEALILDVLAVMERPPSAPKKRLWPAVKPDLSNIVQLVQDALNGLAYPDDSAIVLGEQGKIYGYPPRTLLRLRLATDEDMERVLAKWEKEGGV